MSRLPFRGTLLNTATILVGASIGLLLGELLPEAAQKVVLSGLGLVTIGMGIRMFLMSSSVVVVALAIALGGLTGYLLGFSELLERFADWARSTIGGGNRFNDGLITTSVLYCVGPMTLLGCMQDGLEGKIDLLALKSTLDGIVAVFFAAALGRDGVALFVTAGVVLVFQGALTLVAQKLRPLADDQSIINDLSSTGGVMLLAIGLGLAEVKRFPTEDFLPALLFAPLVALAMKRLTKPGVAPS